MKRRFFLIFPGLAVAAGAAGVILLGKPDPPPNLVLVSIDTLRADRLGCYGYGTGTSPGLDRLAEESLVFTDTVVQSPWTLPSHISLLTSLYPTTHKVGAASRRLDPTVPTLAEILREEGYATAAFVDAEFLAKRYGFDRGFEVYRNTKGKGLGRVLPLARSWLAENPRRPFFLFFHVFDCHCPYTPPPEIADRFSPGYDGDLNLSGLCGFDAFSENELSEKDIRYISEQYDGEICSVDGGLEDLWQLLQKEGLLDDTVVVVTSDHGEEFLEHGRVGHTRSVYRELLQVPLLIRLPGSEPPRGRIGTRVRSIDIAPTLLELAGAAVPARMQGRSLLPLLGSGETGPDREAFSELNELALKRSLIADGYHYILNRDDGSEELYDLEADPAEAHNLAAADEDLTRGFRSRLEKIEERARRDGAGIEEGEVDLSGKTLQELRALGYLQ